MKDKKILILDEALNAVDEKEEFDILRKIINEFVDKTIIYITHRNNCNSLFQRKINFNKLKEDKWN